MRIAVDIDKTLLDCNSILYKIANFLLPSQSSNAKLKYKKIEEKNKSRKSFLSRISKIHNHKFYYINENAKETIEEWYGKGYEIILLSSRPASRALANALLLCINKFDIHFSQVVAACNNKTSFCKENKIDVIVDNSLDICKKCSADGIKSIFYINNKKKAQRYRKETFSVASTWDEINNIVKSFINGKML